VLTTEISRPARQYQSSDGHRANRGRNRDNQATQGAQTSQSEQAKAPEKSPLRFFDWASTLWLSRFARQFEQVTTRQDTASQDTSRQNTSQPESAASIWDSSPYFGRDRVLFGHDQARLHLKNSLITLFHEYAAGLAKKSYVLYSDRGVNNENAEKTSQLCERFEKVMAERGQSIVRAELETWAAKNLELFLHDQTVEPGSILIGISPRGGSAQDGIDEGYPGLDQQNYVFINIFLKTGPNQSCFFQHLSFDTTADLKKLQNSLIREFSSQQASFYQAVPLPESFSTRHAQSLITRAEHEIIASPIVIPAQYLSGSSPEELLQATESQRAKISELVVQNQDDWPVTIEELPTISQSEFDATANQVVARALELFDELAYEFDISQNQHATTHDPAALEKTQDTLRKRACAEYDDLVLSTRDWLLKWVEAVDQAHQNNSTQLPLAIPPLEDVLESWEIRRKEKRGIRLTRQEQDYSKTVLKSLQLVTPAFQRLSSALHCTVGTPASLSSQVNTATSAASKITTISGSVDRLNLLQLSSEARYLSELHRSLTPLKITNRATGNQETIYVWFSDPRLAESYDTSYRLSSRGTLFGPCDVPLSEDNLLNSFSWNTQTHRFLTTDQYQQLTSELFQTNMMATLDKQLTAGVNQQNADTDETATLSNQLTNVISELSRRLFRVTLSSFVSGFHDYTTDFLALPEKCQRYLASAGTHQRQALESLIEILETKDWELIGQRLSIPFTLDQTELDNTKTLPTRFSQQFSPIDQFQSNHLAA